MRILKKLFGKKQTSLGIVSISLLNHGLALAVATDINTKPRLIYCNLLPIPNHDDIAPLLTKLIKEYQLHQYECHLILTADNYRHMNLEQPPVPDEELKAALRWKIADLIDYPIEEAIIDYYHAPPPSKMPDHKFLYVVASRRQDLEDKTDRLVNCGLNLNVVDIQEAPLRNLASLLPENKRGVIILHLRETSGTILIQVDKVVYLSRNLDIGYQKLRLSDQEMSTTELSPTQNHLILEIQRSLDYVENNYNISTISSIVAIPIPEHTQALLNILHTLNGITSRILDISAILDSDTILDDATQCHCAPVIGSTLRYTLEN